MQNFKFFNASNNKSNQHFPSSNPRAEDEGNGSRCPDDTRTPTVNNHYSRVLDDPLNNHTKYDGKVDQSKNCVASEIDDDDDILEVIY